MPFYVHRSLLTMLVLLISTIPAMTQAITPSYGEQLEGFEYPYPLKYYSFQSQKIKLNMKYMDVSPKGVSNGQAVVLLHGKNFCGATWIDTINTLSAQGYRIIVPDQIGFCASSKPSNYQYTFQQLAENTHNLLNSLQINQAIFIGHSTGGMLATRYALMYPQAVSQLVLVNPIGLEDWKAKGVPWRSVDDWYARELKITAESIRNYESNTYYGGKWKPEYDIWVDMLAGLNKGPGHKRVAWNSALIYDMIFTQPVYYELKDLQVKTTLMIGTADTTAIGSDVASPSVKARIGRYDVLGKEAARLIPHSQLIEFEGLGHAPQMQEPEKFHKQLIIALGATKQAKP